MSKKSINLPFINNIKGGNNKSFKILNEEEINSNIKKNPSFMNFIKKMIQINNSNSKSNVNYIKASDTQKYYKNLGLKKKEYEIIFFSIERIY
jgi:hypothetical protein